jgi:hypothetical protein
MQAILKSKHQRFCSWLQSIKDKQAITDEVTDELENEMFGHYNLYLQKREELRAIILQYEEKQKSIRIRMKELQRMQYDLKTTNLVPFENR